MLKSRTKRNQRELNLLIWQRNFARDKIPVKLAKLIDEFNYFQGNFTY